MRRVWTVGVVGMTVFCCAVLSAEGAKNPYIDLKIGLNNFSRVTELIYTKYEKEPDLATLYEQTWLSLAKILPATDVIPSATISPYSSSREIRDFYANRIEQAITLTARKQPDDATPSVRQLWNRASSALVGALEDPYSQFLPAEEHKELQRVLSGEPDQSKQFYGVGISVDWDTTGNEGVLVISPLPGTPAERNGIRAGDIIIAVDGDLLKNWEGTSSEKLTKAIEMIKGEEGTEVKLTLKKPSSPEPVDVILKREPINPELHITKEMLDKEVGYIRLYSFYAHAAEDVLDAIRYLKTEGMTKLIFDLRYNPGGYLDQAVKVADLFLKKDDLITYTYGRNSPERYFYDESTGTDGLTDLPLVVLMNEWSASASEVVTGALKDNHRTLVVGKKSFGKGSVQEVFNLNEGAGLRLTVARYYTPSGVSIHEKGIQPDIEVERLTDEEAEAILQKDYNNVSRLSRLLERDPQLKVALQYLRGEISLAGIKKDPPSKDGVKKDG
ncbi:MAG: S41 family peptidase [Candidatus Omnitrophica bacterium]|nr:S41 family peptidase [Candidatus Omnitrophota bacterium]